jgi:hypothetical protein
MVFDDTTPKDAAGTEPKLTPVAPVREAPWMVMVVPPAVEAEFGEREVTIGGNGDRF